MRLIYLIYICLSKSLIYTNKQKHYIFIFFVLKVSVSFPVWIKHPKSRNSTITLKSEVLFLHLLTNIFSFCTYFSATIKNIFQA